MNESHGVSRGWILSDAFEEDAMMRKEGDEELSARLAGNMSLMRIKSLKMDNAALQCRSCYGP